MDEEQGKMWKRERKKRESRGATQNEMAKAHRVNNRNLYTAERGGEQQIQQQQHRHQQ